jgi:hypothetical protein
LRSSNSRSLVSRFFIVAINAWQELAVPTVEPVEGSSIYVSARLQKQPRGSGYSARIKAVSQSSPIGPPATAPMTRKRTWLMAVVGPNFIGART